MPPAIQSIISDFLVGFSLTQQEIRVHHAFAEEATATADKYRARLLWLQLCHWQDIIYFWNLSPLKLFLISVSWIRYAAKFDEHARKLLSAGPYPVLVPPDGSVYDYCLDFCKGGLVRWEERPGTQLKTLPSTYTVVTEVTLLSDYQYIKPYFMD